LTANQPSKRGYGRWVCEIGRRRRSCSATGSEWTSQISGLKTALNHLHGTVITLASKPSATAVASVATALGAVKTAGTSLAGKVKANCPKIA